MPRPRDRQSAQGLLPRMEARPWADGKTVTYRYHPVGGKPVALGTDREAALRKVLDMLGQAPHHGSLRWVWEQWQTSRRYTRLAAGTQADYGLAWKQIDTRLGRLPAAAITAPMVARYVHIDRAGSPRRADIEKTLLSNLFKHAIMLGVAETNPTLGVEPHGSQPSEVMPETAALKAFLEWLAGQPKQQRIAGLMAEFMARAGNRRVEFIGATWMQYDEKAGVIRLPRAKQRGRAVWEVLEISPGLKAVLDASKALNPESQYIFPDRDGNAYGLSAWKSLWQRCWRNAIAAGVARQEQRFNFHALRRYYATHHKVEHGVLPDLHADKRVTIRHYDGTREVGRKAL